MSYDFILEERIAACAHCKRGATRREVWSTNYTSAMVVVWHDALTEGIRVAGVPMNADPINYLAQHRFDEAKPLLDVAVEFALARRDAQVPAWLKAQEVANNWGSIDGAINVLAEMREHWCMHPLATLRVFR